jgi:hypothetical protein
MTTMCSWGSWGQSTYCLKFIRGLFQKYWWCCLWHRHLFKHKWYHWSGFLPNPLPNFPPIRFQAHAQWYVDIVKQLLIIDALNELGKKYIDFFKTNYVSSPCWLDLPFRKLCILDHAWTMSMEAMPLCLPLDWVKFMW